MTTPARAPSIAPITAAVVAALETTGRPIGRNGAPPTGPDGVSTPYAFVTRTAQTWTGSWANAAEMASIAYQVTCVGATDDEVEWMYARARDVLADAPVVAGWEFIEWLAPEVDPGVRPDDDDPNERLLFTTPIWRLTAMPNDT